MSCAGGSNARLFARDRKLVVSTRWSPMPWHGRGGNCYVSGSLILARSGALQPHTHTPSMRYAAGVSVCVNLVGPPPANGN